MNKHLTIEQMKEHYNMLLERIKASKNENELYGVIDTVDEYAEADGITSSQYMSLNAAIEDKELELSGL